RKALSATDRSDLARWSRGEVVRLVALLVAQNKQYRRRMALPGVAELIRRKELDWLADCVSKLPPEPSRRSRWDKYDLGSAADWLADWHPSASLRASLGYQKNRFSETVRELRIPSKDVRKSGRSKSYSFAVSLHLLRHALESVSKDRRHEIAQAL